MYINAVNNVEYFNNDSLKCVALDLTSGVNLTESSVACSEIKTSTYKAFCELFGVPNILRRDKSLDHHLVSPIVCSLFFFIILIVNHPNIHPFMRLLKKNSQTVH